MIKKIGMLLITILGGALLVYSATRSLDFISLTLPADRQVLAYFGLAALDGGLVAWLLSYLYGSRGAWQRAIAILMLMVDILGAIAMFTLDTLYNTGKNGMTAALTPDEILMAVLGLSGIIALNIIATVAHHITDPDKLREQAEEEAFAKVEDATIKQISKNAETLAAQLAPIMAADWQTQTQAKYLSYVGTGKLPMIDATAQDVKSEKIDKPIFNLGALFSGWAAKKPDMQTYQSVTVAPEVKAEDTAEPAAPSGHRRSTMKRKIIILLATLGAQVTTWLIIFGMFGTKGLIFILALYAGWMAIIQYYFQDAKPTINHRRSRSGFISGRANFAGWTSRLKHIHNATASPATGNAHLNSAKPADHKFP